jgi:hypothetical protein
MFLEQASLPFFVFEMEVESPGLYINMHLYFLGSSLLLSEARELVKRVHHPYLWFGSIGGSTAPPVQACRFVTPFIM